MTPEEAAAQFDSIAHNDQLVIWADEVIDAIAPWLKEPETYDDKVQLAVALTDELRRIAGSVLERAAERAGATVEQRIARLERELADARKAQDGANALLCDAQAEIAELREDLEGKVQECILLGASLRKADDVLRPFGEAYRAIVDLGGAAGVAIVGLKEGVHIDLDLADFARAAEQVPEKPEP